MMMMISIGISILVLVNKNAQTQGKARKSESSSNAPPSALRPRYYQDYDYTPPGVAQGYLGTSSAAYRPGYGGADMRSKQRSPEGKLELCRGRERLGVQEGGWEGCPAHICFESRPLLLHLLRGLAST